MSGGRSGGNGIGSGSRDGRCGSGGLGGGKSGPSEMSADCGRASRDFGSNGGALGRRKDGGGGSRGSGRGLRS